MIDNNYLKILQIENVNKDKHNDKNNEIVKKKNDKSMISFGEVLNKTMNNRK